MMAVAVVLGRKAHRRGSSEFIGCRKAYHRGSSEVEKLIVGVVGGDRIGLKNASSGVVGVHRESKSVSLDVVGNRKVRRRGSSEVEKHVVRGRQGSKSASSKSSGLDFFCVGF